MSKSRDTKVSAIDGGMKCPMCRQPMQRYIHGQDWKPPEAGYYFKYWDRCKSCGHHQNYEKAKVTM